MRESRQSFWVGLFVLAGLGALGVLIVLFGQTGFWTRPVDAFVLNVHFERAPGIRQGTIVTIGGLPIGRVSDFGFMDPDRFDAGVKVEVVIDPGCKLHRGSRAATNEPGLGEGRPPIRIIPGPSDAPLLASGETIPGETSSAVEQLIPQAIISNFDRTATRFGEAAAALTPVLEDVHQILQPRQVSDVDRPGGPPGNLSSALARFDSSLRHFNEVLGDPEVKSQLRASLDNLHIMTEDGKIAVAEMRTASADIRTAATEAIALAEQASGSITRIDGHVEQLAHSLTEDLEIASRFLTRMHSLAEKADRGEGTLGQLLMDDRLYESLVLTFRRLAETVEELRLLVKDWQKGKIRVGL